MNDSNKKDVVVHIFDLFLIIGSVVAGVFYLHSQIDRIDQRVEQRMLAQEQKCDALLFRIIDLYKDKTNE
jgi:uncharacterized membrane protein YciS (DUF1049 family)